MKSWADHCSSDEESDDGRAHHPSNLPPDGAAGGRGGHPFIQPESDDELGSHEDDEESYDENALPPRREHPTIPSHPPFTAHLANLSYDMKEGDHLAHEVEQLVQRRFRGEKSVKVTSARLGVDRETGKRKGFGYVEFGTAEELMTLLDLNDGRSDLCGRAVRMDVAAPPRNKRQSNRDRGGGPGGRGGGDFGGGPGRGGRGGDLPEIDGSQFRGGRYSQQGGGSGRGPGLGGDRPSSGSNIGGGGGDGGGKGGGGGGPPGQRPSLKLAPRSKPADGEKGGSQSSIFGDAKPRDQASWQSCKSSATEAQIKKSSSSSAKEEDSGTKAGGGEAPAASDRSGDGGGGGGKNKQTKSSSQSGGGRGEGKGQGGGSGRDGGRGKGRGRDGNRRDNKKDSGRGGRGGGKGRGADKQSSSGGGGSKGGGGGGRKRGSAKATGEEATAGGANPAQRTSSGKLPAPQAAPKAKKTVKVTNQFAAFGFDSDSD